MVFCPPFINQVGSISIKFKIIFLILVFFIHSFMRNLVKNLKDLKEYLIVFLKKNYSKGFPL